MAAREATTVGCRDAGGGVGIDIVNQAVGHDVLLAQAELRAERAAHESAAAAYTREYRTLLQLQALQRACEQETAKLRAAAGFLVEQQRVMAARVAVAKSEVRALPRLRYGCPRCRLRVTPPRTSPGTRSCTRRRRRRRNWRPC